MKKSRRNFLKLLGVLPALGLAKIVVADKKIDLDETSELDKVNAKFEMACNNTSFCTTNTSQAWGKIDFEKMVETMKKFREENPMPEIRCPMKWEYTYPITNDMIYESGGDVMTWTINTNPTYRFDYNIKTMQMTPKKT